MLARRASEDLKNKSNVIPSISRKYEATAEDFREIGAILDDHAGLLDELTGAGSTNKFYQFWGSLDLLIAAHPSAEEDAYAVIEPAGKDPQIARFKNGVWILQDSKALIVTVDTFSALPEPGEEKVLYIVKDSISPYLWLNGQYIPFLEQKIKELQREFGDVKSSMNSLQNYVQNAFTDGFIDAAEAKGIAKYINSLNTQKSESDSRYDSLASSPNLSAEQKAALAIKKTAFDAAHNSLIQAINNAIEDGVATPEEAEEVDYQFGLYATAVSGFTTAIQVALEQAEAARLEEKIKAIEVGGRNILLRSETLVFAKDGDTFFYTAQSNDLVWPVPSLLFTSSGRADYNPQNVSEEIAGEYVFSIEVLGENVTVRANESENTTSGDPTRWRRISVVTTAESQIRFEIEGASEIRLPKLESGNKATGWSAAPEDIHEEILQAQEAARRYAAAQDELQKALQESYTDGKITEEAQARIADLEAKLAAAKSYADAQIAIEKTLQEAYADGILDASEQRLIQQMADQLEAAKEYSDAAITLEQIRVDALIDGEISEAEARIIEAAEQNLLAAKTYAEAQAEAAQIAAQAHADGEITASEQRAINAANAAAQAAKDHAEAQDTLLQVLLESHVDGEITEAETRIITAAESAAEAAKTYAEAQAEAAQIAAQAHADGEISASEQRAINAANAAAQAAKDHAEAQDTLLQVLLESHVDGEITEAETRIISAAESAAEAAKTYAEVQAEAAQIAAQAHADGEISASEQRAINAANAAAQAAKDHADAEDALLQVLLETNIDGKITAEEQERIAEAERNLVEAKAHAEAVVDGIQIGGRNLLLNSERYAFAGAIFQGDHYKVNGSTTFTAHTNSLSWPQPSLLFRADFSVGSFNPKNITADFLQGNIVMSLDVRGTGTLEVSATAGNESNTTEFDLSSSWNRVGIFISAPAGNQKIDYSFTGNFEYRYPQVEQGTKFTDWSAAKEDIDSAVNQLHSNLGSLELNVRDFQDNIHEAIIDPAISTAELSSILKFKNSILGQHATVYASYTVLVNNQFLTGSPKSQLQQAYTAYNIAREDLLITIDSAIANSHVSPQESATIDLHFEEFVAEISNLNSQIQAAQVAIDAARDSQYDNDNLMTAEELNNLHEVTQILEGKLNWLDPEVRGSAVMAGTFAFGNSDGGLGGMTGVLDRGEDSVLLWLAETFANRYNAPLQMKANGSVIATLLHIISRVGSSLRGIDIKDGILTITDSQGVIRFELGIDNEDEFIFNFYNKSGTQTLYQSDRGIEFIGYVAESYRNANVFSLSSASSPTDLTLRNQFISKLKQEMVMGEPGRIPNHDEFFTYRAQLTGPTEAYTYNAGTNAYSAGNKEYEGFYYAVKNKLSENYIGDGWYCGGYGNIFYWGTVDLDGDGIAEFYNGNITGQFEAFQVIAGKRIESSSRTISFGPINGPNLPSL